MNPEVNLCLCLFQVPFIIWNPASNEDRQEGDEEIYGWSDRKLLHLSSPSPLECLTKTTIHPQTPAPHWVSERGALWRSQEWRRSSLTHVGPKCDWVVFTRGVLWGRVGLGLGPGLRCVVDGLKPVRTSIPFWSRLLHHTFWWHLLPPSWRATSHGTHDGQRERTKKDKLKDWDCAYKQHRMAGKSVAPYSDISCPLTDAL